MPTQRSYLAPFSVLVALAAFTLAAIAVVASAGNDRASVAAGPGSAGAPVEVMLHEFAIMPGDITAPVGGSLHISNEGSVAHNVEITGTDRKTADIAPGAAATLDLAGLDAGTYDVICAIPGHAGAGMKATLTIGDATATPSNPAMDYPAMEQAMESSIGRFPAGTAGTGNAPLAPAVLADGTKQFELTAAITKWEVSPGKVVDAWTYNGTVPGPLLRVEVGDKVAIVLHNDLPVSTDLHLHGINVDNTMDGVGYVTQDPVLPGESFTYTFTADEPAVAMYHAHNHGEVSVPNGLLGALLVGEMPLPVGRTISGRPLPAAITVAQEVPMVLSDAGVIGLGLNGKSFPATAPLTGHQGDWIEVHYMNEGLMIHPMHLHQFDQLVIAKDGFPLDQPYYADTISVAPGERYTVLVHLDKPGTWVWHCHILNHAESETGMFGMVTAVVVS